MAEFKSPGFFEREIDLSQRVTEKPGTPPGGIIGTAKKGPAFVPTTVDLVGFRNTFGENEDLESAGMIAAEQFLSVGNSPLTYIRVLGAGANSTSADIGVTQAKGTVKNAGFILSGSKDLSMRNKGDVKFISAIHEVTTDEYVNPDFSKNSSIGNTSSIPLIRGMILMASGARLGILDYNQSFSVSNESDDVAKIQSYDGTSTQGTFKLVLSSALGSTFGNAESFSGIRIYTASLDPANSSYIGKILNTNPDRFHTEQHLLYADFPVSEVARVKYSANQTVGILSGSELTLASAGGAGTPYNQLFGNFGTRYKSSESTWFISQPFGAVEYDLFKFESLDDGSYGNGKIKISISNIKRSIDPKNPWGTFTVLVRDFRDNDANPVIFEQFSGCNLNPNSPNYVATKIGDIKQRFNFDAESENDRKLITGGTRENRSSFVRIVMHPAVEEGQIPASTLPFGFRGLPLLKTTNSLTDNWRTLAGASNNVAGTTRIVHGGNSNTLALTGSILPPVPFRYKVTKGQMSDSQTFSGDPSDVEIVDTRLYWGMRVDSLPSTGTLSNAIMYPNVVGDVNSTVSNYTKMLGIAKLDVLVTGSGADLFCDNKFSLSKIALGNRPASSTTSLEDALTSEITGSAAEHMREAFYLRNAAFTYPRMTARDSSFDRLTVGSLVSSRVASHFNKFTDYMKFTNILFGGFDGVNILDKDQRLLGDISTSTESGGKAAGDSLGYMNLSSVSSPGAGSSNNAIASYRTAIRIMTDPFISTINVLALPDIRDSYVTDYAADLVREYGMAIYVMDIPSYDSSSNRLFIGSSGRPSRDKTIEAFEGRAYDNSFATTYFPDVWMSLNGISHLCPASIAALRSFAYNDKVSFPWFAPAGFSRGSLDNVVNTLSRLTTADRNALYEARINPIASISGSGYVIWGQKTLQITPSLTDRVNVRRLLLRVKRIVTDAANEILFEQNNLATRNKFLKKVNPALGVIQSLTGIKSFKVTIDTTGTNSMSGTIQISPIRATEFISIDFIITNSSVSFV